MTVTVRPYPKRTYQNGIRPFRPVVPANNIRPYTLKTWRPPVPEPLPPAPLLGLKELLGLGLLVLAQLWGRINSFKHKKYIPATGGQVTVLRPVEGKFNPAGGNRVTRGAFRATFVDDRSGVCVTGSQPVKYPAQSRTESFPLRELKIVIGEASNCGFLNSGFFLGYGTGSGTRAMGGLPAGSGGDGWMAFSFDGWTVEPLNPAAPNLQDAASLAPWDGTVEVPNREQVPVVVPQVAPTIQPIAPSPVRPPALPEFEPSVVPTTPGPTAPPATAPQVPRRTVPLPLPGATPTKDGAIVPQAPAPVAVTPPDAHFPVPGAPPVTGNGPRPTPEGIAQELGRLEQKLAKMLNPGPDGPGDGTDRQQLLEQRMRQIWEFLTSITAGGGYGLSSPCELDENGERIVTTVEYGGGFNSLDVLSNKIDALAALLQVHKDLKQPICKQTPAVGQPVTVDFLQVD